MKNYFFTYLVILFSLTYVYAEVPQNTNTQITTKISIETELNADDIKRLNAREFIIKTKDIAGSPWPEITYYALVEAAPLDSIAIFAAYDIQKDYTPNVLVSKPVKHITSTDVQTEYELRIPFPLPNAHYTHGARIYRHQNDYEVAWYMVKSTSTDDVRGSAYFRDYNGKTLFRYRSFVIPKSIFGSFVKKMMLKDVQASVKAIINFIEKNKRENSPLLSKYSEFITRALSGEFVYQTIIEKK
jgi:hypothetical protein